MNEKRFNSRIVHKHDTETNWLKSSLIPLQGELIIYDIEDGVCAYERLKIGDGIHNVNALPFADDYVKAQIDEFNTTVNDMSDDISDVKALVGDTAVSTQIAEAVMDKASKYDVLQTVEATTEDGIAYVATVPGVVELTLGQRFVLITETTSKSTTPTLNINGLGEKNVRRRLSTGASVAPGYATGWITKNQPYMFIYDGLQWVVEGQEKPVGLDLYGPVQATHDSNGNDIIETYATKIEMQKILPKVTDIYLPAANWTGDTNPYSQIVNVSGVTENSKIDLQPTAIQIVELQDADIALVAENDAGVVTVYALGGKPEVNYTMQAFITEVAAI